MVWILYGIIRRSPRRWWFYFWLAARAFQILGEVDLADPNPSPFIPVWLYNHPPLGDRVRFALTYDPWVKGESPEFVK